MRKPLLNARSQVVEYQTSSPMPFTRSTTMSYENFRTGTLSFREPFELVFGPASDRITHSLSANPRFYGNSKVLGIQGSIFSRYKPKAFRLHYIPRCSAMTEGEVIIGSMFGDAEMGPISDEALLASPGGISFQPFCEATYECPISMLLRGKVGDVEETYNCEPEHGVLSEPYILLVKVSGAQSGFNLGRFEIEWTYEFFGVDRECDAYTNVPGVTVPFNSQPSLAGPVTLNLPKDHDFTSLLLETVPQALSSMVKPGLRYLLKWISNGASEAVYELLDESNQPITTKVAAGTIGSSQASAGVRSRRPDQYSFLEEFQALVDQEDPVVRAKIDKGRFLARREPLAAISDGLKGESESYMIVPPAQMPESTKMKALSTSSMRR